MKMRNILGSVAVIAVVATLGYVGTSAYFSDTETSKDNVFTTGTIDIAVDGTNPWAMRTPYKLEDMKPGYVDNVKFTIKNVGDNSANVWKKISVTDRDNNPVSEPECQAEGGTWTPDVNAQPYLGTCSNNTAQTNLEEVVLYGLNVKVKDANGTQVWEQVVYSGDVTLANAYSTATEKGLYLGMLPAGWTMDVEQSYKMSTDAGNEYQGDTIKFDIALYAEQLTNTVRLENKNPSNWQWVLSDGYYADLTYGVKESKFGYSLSGKAPLANTSYTLLFYTETWTVPAYTANTHNVVLGTTTSGADGTVTMSGSVDLGYNLSQMKVWLVPSSYVDSSGKITDWTMRNFLFETGLIDYYDADL